MSLMATDNSVIDWLVNFNGMSTRLGLFYAEKLWNLVHRKFICAFLYNSFLSGLGVGGGEHE